MRTEKFEEERDVGGQARIAEFAYPWGIYRAGTRARIAATYESATVRLADVHRAIDALVASRRVA
jgi:hypothetical protein